MEEIALTLKTSLSRLTPSLILIITPILVKDSVNLLRKHPTATFVISQVIYILKFFILKGVVLTVRNPALKISVDHHKEIIWERSKHYILPSLALTSACAFSIFFVEWTINHFVDQNFLYFFHTVERFGHDIVQCFFKLTFEIGHSFLRVFIQKNFPAIFKLKRFPKSNTENCETNGKFHHYLFPSLIVESYFP